MTGLWILLTAVLVYLAFRVWYDNGRGPLRREGIDIYLEWIEGSGLSDTRDLNSMRRFMEGGHAHPTNLIEQKRRRP